MSFLIYDYLENKDSYKEININDFEDISIESSQKVLIKNDIVISGIFINKGHLVFENCGFLINGGVLDNKGKISFIPSIDNKDKLQKKIIYILDRTIKNDFEFTGFYMKEDSNNKISITVESNNSSFFWCKKFESLDTKSPFYFSSDNGKTANLNIKKNDKLYCNPSYLKSFLYKDWFLKITF